MVSKSISIKNDAEAIDWLVGIGAMSMEEAFTEKARTVQVADTLGGVNRFYFHCQPTDNGMSYGVCRHIIQAFQEKRLAGFNECVPHLENGNCPAMKMLAAETEAGHAIFYVKGRTPEERVRDKERQEQAIKDARTKSEKEWAARIEERKAARREEEERYRAEHPEEAAPAPTPTMPGSGSYADAINAALAEAEEVKPAAPIARAGRKAPATISRGAKISATPSVATKAPEPVAPQPTPGRISLAEIARNKLKAGQ